MYILVNGLYIVVKFICSKCWRKSPGGGVGGGGGGTSICWGYGDVPPVRAYFFEDMCSLRVYVFANFSCLCPLRYAFPPHSKLCVPSGYTISRFFIVFYVPSGSWSGSLCGTTLSTLVRSVPPPPLEKIRGISPNPTPL